MIENASPPFVTLQKSALNCFKEAAGSAVDVQGKRGHFMTLFSVWECFKRYLSKLEGSVVQVRDVRV